MFFVFLLLLLIFPRDVVAIDKIVGQNGTVINRLYCSVFSKDKLCQVVKKENKSIIVPTNRPTIKIEQKSVPFTTTTYGEANINEIVDQKIKSLKSQLNYYYNISKGDKGDKGNTGSMGAKGDKGDRGDVGTQGAVGETGSKGDVGSSGVQGPQGLKGDKGETGDVGSSGVQGPQGLKGDDGSGAHNISELSDIGLADLANNNLLSYSTSVSKWVNITVANLKSLLGLTTGDSPNFSGLTLNSLTSAGFLKNNTSGAISSGTISNSDLPSDGYANTYFNTTGDTITGQMILSGSGVVWEDMMIPGFSVPSGNAAPDFLTSFAGSNTIYRVYSFNGAGATPIEEVMFSVQLPHSYKQGSDIYPHIHWSPIDNNSGNVVWKLEYTWTSVGSTFPTTVTIGTSVASTDATAWKHKITSFPSISGTGKNISSMLMCRLYRDPGDNGDTYNSDAAFLQFDIHYQADSLGSSQEGSK